MLLQKRFSTQDAQLQVIQNFLGPAKGVDSISQTCCVYTELTHQRWCTNQVLMATASYLSHSRIILQWNLFTGFLIYRKVSSSTLLYKMPSNLKGKNFVSKFPGYCPQNAMVFFFHQNQMVSKNTFACNTCRIQMPSYSDLSTCKK